MDDLPRQKLAELIRRYGREIASNARRCEALLRDACPQHKREIVVLASAAKESVGVELLNNSSGVPKEVLLSRLAKRLHDNLGMAEDFARWAVESWALALGVATPEDFRLPFMCPGCGAAGTMPARLAGRRVTCPKCKAVLSIPGDGQRTEVENGTTTPPAGPCDLVAGAVRPARAAPFSGMPPSASNAEIKQKVPAVAGPLSVITNAIGMRLMLIPAGDFLMGSPDSDDIATAFYEDTFSGEPGPCPVRPQHRVRITRPFYLGVTPVTQEQWKAVMCGYTENFDGRQNPVWYVSWYECQQFLKKLNDKSGPGGSIYRFPTEAEWEYACRAGSETRYCYGDDEKRLGEYAWYDANSGKKRTHPVGQKKPNAWGLYDMHGNVSEWCWDWFHEEYYEHSPVDGPTGPRTGLYRVFRGGDCFSVAFLCASAHRCGRKPDWQCGQGFRVAADSVATGSAGLTGSEAREKCNDG